MNELLDVFLEKLRKPFWRAFSISWLTWNWQIWYLTLFVNSDIIGNKLEYIIKKYKYFYDYKSNFEIFGINFYNLIFPELAIILHWFLIPLGLSYTVVWHFPKITNKYLEKNKKTREEENRIMKEEIESETKVLEAKKENKIIKEELQDIDEKNQYKEWDNEYEDLLKIENGKSSLNSLSELIFEHSGYFKDNGYWNIPKMDFELLTLFSLFESRLGDWSGTMTDKGKYFLLKLSKET